MCDFIDLIFCKLIYEGKRKFFMTVFIMEVIKNDGPLFIYLFMKYVSALKEGVSMFWYL